MTLLALPLLRVIRMAGPAKRTNSGRGLYFQGTFSDATARAVANTVGAYVQAFLAPGYYPVSRGRLAKMFPGEPDCPGCVVVTDGEEDFSLLRDSVTFAQAAWDKDYWRIEDIGDMLDFNKVPEGTGHRE